MMMNEFRLGCSALGGNGSQKWIVVAVVKRIDLSCVYLLLLLLVSLTKENDREREALSSIGA